MFWYLGNQAPVDRCNHHPRLMNGGCCILINPTALAVDEGCRGRDHLTRTLGKGGLKGRGDFYFQITTALILKSVLTVILVEI